MDEEVRLQHVTSQSIIPGISLRDWFAGLVLNGRIGNDSELRIAEFAYRMADRMISERQIKRSDET